MLALKIFLIIVEVVCALLLIGVILLQKAKGQGLGLAFGAEMGESIFGAHASNVLVKVTIWLGAIFMATTVILAAIYSNSHSTSLLGSRPPPPAAEQPVMPAQTTPQQAMPAMPLPAPTVPSAPAPQAPAAP